MRPSLTAAPAPLAAMFSAFSRPFFLMISRALFLSPAASSSARLQSIMPAPVSRRRSLTVFASMFAMVAYAPAGAEAGGGAGGRRRGLRWGWRSRGPTPAAETAPAEAAAGAAGHGSATGTTALADVDRALPV